MRRLISCLLLLSSAALARETLTLTTSDGASLYAEYHATKEAPKAAVLLLHQIDGNTCEYGNFPETLTELGYAVLAVDLRVGGSAFGCQNRSKSPILPDVWDVPLDLEAAVKWLLSATKLPKVILTGSSYSGGQVLMYAGAHPDQVQGVVAFSPASSMDLIPDVIDAVKKIEAPVLFVAPSTETGFPSNLLPLIPSAGSGLVVPAGTTHGAVGLIQPDTGPEYQQIMLKFLASLVK